ncbi:hypothetical protein GCG54_00015274 [Colletotrichum gloeosporioides]|uniref:Uncharacterized protein n=1 Tax=Colletotrichum gloeosporioides TaxID=474922 RepID=A0A8H4C700_COLGL|nr:uncharacterized protein GCG54_00015274 [Colletotrichum gloeosporioides]KAF3798293.1 hypothetical protein GCG54_00015274 [Colletotrichum gloeosporioides]
MRELRPRPTTTSQAPEDDHQEAAAHIQTVQHLASQAVVTSPTKLRNLVHHVVQSSDTPVRSNVCLGIIANVSTAKAAGKLASELLDDDALEDIHIQARDRRLEQYSSADAKRHQRQLEYLDGHTPGQTLVSCLSHITKVAIAREIPLESLWQASGLLEGAVHTDAKGTRRLRVLDLRHLKKSFLVQANSGGPRTETSTPTRPTPTRPTSTTPDPASELDTPERARGDPKHIASAQSLLKRQELSNPPIDPDFDPFDETASQPLNHGKASEDATSQTQLHSRFLGLEYEEQSFDLGGNSPEPGDNDEDMAPAPSTEGRPSLSWETRFKKLVQAPHVDVTPGDMMLVVPSMVNDDDDSSYGTSKAGLVFDFPLPPEHQFTEIQTSDKIVLLLHHAQSNGKWTCLHVVNYSAGTRNLVSACHIDCAPDRQRRDRVEGFVRKVVTDFMPHCEMSFSTTLLQAKDTRATSGILCLSAAYHRTKEKDKTTLLNLPAYDERPFPMSSENARKRPFPEEPGSPDPAGETKRRFLEYWTPKEAAEDVCERAAGFIPQLEKRKKSLSGRHKDLTHASSAALKDVSRHRRTKKWASMVASLTEDHDDQDPNDQDSDDQDSEDQDSDAEDVGIREATDAFIERARAAGYNGESVEKATKDVKSAVERSKKLKSDLSAVCSSEQKVKAAITDLENFKRQQKMLREAITAVRRLDSEDWVKKNKIDLLVKKMAEETQEEDT